MPEKRQMPKVYCTQHPIKMIIPSPKEQTDHSDNNEVNDNTCQGFMDAVHSCNSWMRLAVPVMLL